MFSAVAMLIVVSCNGNENLSLAHVVSRVLLTGSSYSLFKSYIARAIVPVPEHPSKTIDSLFTTESLARSSAILVGVAY